MTKREVLGGNVCVDVSHVRREKCGTLVGSIVAFLGEAGQPILKFRNGFTGTSVACRHVTAVCLVVVGTRWAVGCEVI
jgi:hypothetical protein